MSKLVRTRISDTTILLLTILCLIIWGCIASTKMWFVIFPFIVLVIALGAGVDEDAARHISYADENCPYCGSEETYTIVNYRPFGKSSVTYECMTKTTCRQRKFKTTRSQMCKDHVVAEDTI